MKPDGDYEQQRARFIDYRRLSAVDKASYHHDQNREPALRCPGCDTAVLPEDLLAHQSERCPGRGEPHHLSRWITWGDAIKLGVARGTLSRWVRKGHVRSRGEKGQRKYLARDVIYLVAQRRIHPGI